MTNILVVIALILRIISNPYSNVQQKKITSKNVNPLFISFISYLLLSSISLFILIFYKVPSLNSQFWFNSIIAGVLGAIGNGFLVMALKHGDLSVLGPINSYKSIVSIVVTFILFHKLPPIQGIPAIALIIFGSYFVINSSNSKFKFSLLKRREYLYRVLAMILTATEAVFIKEIVKNSNTVVSFISWSIFGAIFTLILLLIFKIKIVDNFKLSSDKSTISRFIILASSIGTMQFTTNYIFKYMNVSFALSLFQLSIVLTLFFGYKFFNEKNIRRKVFGSVIMIFGSVILIFI